MPLVNDDLDLTYYINCKKLVCCYIGLANEIEHHKLDKNITLWKLLGCCPKVKHLYLDGAFLRVLTHFCLFLIYMDEVFSTFKMFY